MPVPLQHRGRHLRREPVAVSGGLHIGLVLSVLVAATAIGLSGRPAQAETSIIELRVASGGDDAEEDALGTVDVSSGDLELTFDGTDQVVGLRFASIALPVDAEVTAAELRFTADETSSGPTELVIAAQAVDDAGPFTSTPFDISSRTRTAGSVTWTTPAWVAGDSGPAQRSPDLAALVSEVVERPGWSQSSALVFVITGSGDRAAESFEGGDADSAPILHLEYTSQAPVDCAFWVAPGGSDTATGSAGDPWATLNHAARTVPDAGCTVLVAAGAYQGPVTIERRFATETVFRSERPYRAVLEHTATVVDVDGAHHVTLEGFEIRHAGPGSTGYVVIVDRDNGDGVWSEHVTFRDNVVHDSYDNDLLKLHSGVRFASIEGNVFYNQGPHEQHLDINSVTDIAIRDNVFFNDFARSGRSTPPDSKHFIVVKDSGGSEDGLVGSERVTIGRNVFLNWQGGPEALIQIGNDGKDYHEAIGVRVENNLIVGNGADLTSTPFGVAGVRDVVVVNNTVTGDLPAGSYGLRVERKAANPPNENIVFANNIWSDPTGTMDEFSNGLPDDTVGLVLDTNLYWNGGAPLPSGELLDPSVDDPSPLIADAGLNAEHGSVVVPYWTGAAFLSGETSVRAEFLRLVTRYGSIPAGSPAGGASGSVPAPDDDILGNPRDDAPDLGAFEILGDAAPLAGDDVTSTTSGTPVVVDVLANDSDPNGDLDPTSVTTDCGACTGPDRGSALASSLGTITYTPDDGFEGVDAFVYEICDDLGQCDTATVTVTVHAPTTNQPPLAVADTSSTTAGSAVSIDVLANDSDPDGDPISVVDVTEPAHGSATADGGGAVTYTPVAGFSGTDAFTYRAHDGSLSSEPATVTVSVMASSTFTPVSEQTVLGSISNGDLGALGSVDGMVEGLTEEHSGGRPSGRTSSLDHRWVFEIGAATGSLVVDAHHSANSESDDFELRYSTDGGSTFQALATPLVVTATAPGTTLVAPLPAGVGGTVVIQAIDLDRTPGHGGTDTLFVDRLVVEAGDAPEPVPVVTVAASDPEASEAGDPGRFTFTRSDPAGSLLVSYAAGGSATGGSSAAGADYQALSGVATFAAGEAEVHVDVVPFDDLASEGAEAVVVTIDAAPGYWVGVPGSATVTITDDDIVSADHVAMSETTSSGSVTAGSLVATHFDDGVTEEITEASHGGGQRTRLEHQWTFEVSGAGTVTFILRAGVSGAESFVFEYSTNGSGWTPMVVVTPATALEVLTSALPAGTGGTVLVRVIDQDRSRGDVTLDAVRVDHMVIRTAS